MGAGRGRDREEGPESRPWCRRRQVRGRRLMAGNGLLRQASSMRMRAFVGTEVSVFRMSLSLTAWIGMSASRFSRGRSEPDNSRRRSAGRGRRKHQSYGIGALGRHLAGEFADLLPHLALRQIRGRRHLEAGIGQQLRHRPGVIGRIGQRRHRTIGGLSDHQREAIFGTPIEQYVVASQASTYTTVEWDAEMRLLEGGSRYRGYDPVWSNRLGDRPQASRHSLADSDAAVRPGDDPPPCPAAMATG